jgi:hypothetical protein
MRRTIRGILRSGPVSTNGRPTVNDDEAFDVVRRTRGLIVIAVGVAMGLMSPYGMAAEPRPSPVSPAPESGASSPVLRVQVVDAIDDAALIPGWIADRNPRLAEELLLIDGLQPWIAVEIGGATYDYWVSVTPMRDGKAVGPAVKPRLCECNSETLLEVIDAAIAEAVATLNAVEEQPAVTASSTTERGADETTVAPPPRVKRRRFSGLGIGGAVLTGFGATAVGAGVTMLRLSPLDVGTRDLKEVPWTGPAYGALVGGGAVLLIGVTMVIVDATRCRRDWTASRCERRVRERLEVAPAIGTRHAGITIIRRF